MQPPESLKKLDDWRVLVRPEGYQARESAGHAIARRIAPPLFLAVGLVLLVAAMLESMGVWRLEQSGVRAPGVVSSFDASRCDSRNLPVCVHAVVTYATSSGQRVSFRDGYGSDPSRYRVGQTVIVLYRAGSPRGAIIDRGIGNWIGAAALYVLGGGLALFGIGIRVKFARTSRTRSTAACSGERGAERGQ